jgi:hypothetical protein
MQNLSFIKPLFLKDLVRVGNANDGGYVINKRCIDQTKHLVGLGVNTDWSFEEDFYKRKKDIDVACFDFSVSAGKFLKNAVRSFYKPTESWFWLSTMFKFRKFFKGNRKFYKKGITDYSNEWFIQFNEVFKTAGITQAPENSVFLKIDIEQAEYRIMNQVLTYASQINGMVIEFHDIDLLWNKFEAIMSALSQDFVVTHVHGNNAGEPFPDADIPRSLEITIVKRDLISDSERAVNGKIQYPIRGLDAPNLPARPDFILNFE